MHILQAVSIRFLGAYIDNLLNNRVYLVDDHLLYSRGINVWFRGDLVRRNWSFFGKPLSFQWPVVTFFQSRLASMVILFFAFRRPLEMRILLKKLKKRTLVVQAWGRRAFYLIKALPFNPWGWLACNFSFQYHTWIKHEGHENKGNDNQLRNLLIIKQILLASI